MAKQLTFLASIESYSFSDVHLFKDVLLVPLLLGRYLHYHVTIVCHSLNAELLHTYFPDADFDYIPYDSYENHLLNNRPTKVGGITHKCVRLKVAM